MWSPEFFTYECDEGPALCWIHDISSESSLSREQDEEWILDAVFDVDKIINHVLSSGHDAYEHASCWSEHVGFLPDVSNYRGQITSYCSLQLLTVAPVSKAAMMSTSPWSTAKFASECI